MKHIQSIFVSVMLVGSLLIFPVAVFASTSTTSGATQKTDTVEVTTTTKVEYELPYPGLLPDSPLYFLKQFRDWLLDKLIVDPTKKAEFYILQADKRLSMGVLLAQKGNGTLSEQVISKGEKYMNSAVDVLALLKSQGKEVPAYIVDHLTKAMIKHIEVLQELIAKAIEPQKAALTASLEFVKKLQEELVKLK